MKNASDFARWLAERGFTIWLRNNRVGLLPKTAFRFLTAEERNLWRKYRPELKALAMSGAPIPPALTREPAPSPIAPPMTSAPIAPSAPNVILASMPALPKPIEPDPSMSVFGHPITDADVREAMKAMGDDMLNSYVSGQLPKIEAYRMTARGVRELAERRGRTSRTRF